MTASDQISGNRGVWVFVDALANREQPERLRDYVEMCARKCSG